MSAPGPSSGGGSSAIVSDTTAISGGTDTQACYNNAGKLKCGDSGLVYNETTNALSIRSVASPTTQYASFTHDGSDLILTNSVFGGKVRLSNANTSSGLITDAGIAIDIVGSVLRINTGSTITLDRTITAAGTTGAQTINKLAGTVNFAAAAASVVVTDSICTANSLIFTTIRTSDATCVSIKNVVPGAGTFTITMAAACTAETSVGFWVTN